MLASLPLLKACPGCSSPQPCAQIALLSAVGSLSPLLLSHKSHIPPLWSSAQMLCPQKDHFCNIGDHMVMSSLSGQKLPWHPPSFIFCTALTTVGKDLCGFVCILHSRQLQEGSRLYLQCLGPIELEYRVRGTSWSPLVSQSL